MTYLIFLVGLLCDLIFISKVLKQFYYTNELLNLGDKSLCSSFFNKIITVFSA